MLKMCHYFFTGKMYIELQIKNRLKDRKPKSVSFIEDHADLQEVKW